MRIPGAMLILSVDQRLEGVRMSRMRRGSERSRGQSLAEFAIVFPVLMLILGGIIQFGIIFWGLNTLTQVVRDTGRWAASQQSCTATAPIVSKANAIAAQSSLIGYTSGSWTSSNVAISWQTTPNSDPCPPTTNQQTSFVIITVTHQVPIFFPFVPGSGNLTTSGQFRMEPAP
jgi:Flp pilus assembly protein TadG